MATQQQIYSQLEERSKKGDQWVKEKEYEKKSTENLLHLIMQVPSFDKRLRVLDVGCGSGNLCKILTETYNAEVVGIDVSNSEIQRAKKRAPKAKFYVTALEDFTSEKKFDVIVCSEVLYYILDRKHLIKKLQKLGNYLITSHFVVCFPIFSIQGLRVEYELLGFPLLDRIIERSWKYKLLVIKSLRKLN